MDFSTKTGNPLKYKTACLVVASGVGQHTTATARLLNSRSRDLLTRLRRQGDFSGALGQTVMLHDVAGVSAERVLLIGCGKQREFDATRFRKMISAAMRKVSESGARDAILCTTELLVNDCDSYWKVRQAVELTEAAGYRFDTMKSKKPKRPVLRKVSLHVADGEDTPLTKQAEVDGKAFANGAAFMRDLANLPANYCTPSFLAEQARAIGASDGALKVRVLEEAQMRELGMGALLAVSQGSRQPAKLIVLEYRGGPQDQAPIALIGKGVTFDSGGISIKPPGAMDEMKFDMSGAASVLGTFVALTQLQLPLNVVGVVPATENLPDGEAIKPGDIVTSMSGQTIEILNTDAEGRLILCDAMTYVEQFKPRAVIDIATLTGACVVALGSHAMGLFSSDDELANALLDAGEFSGDRAWRMPLWDEYQEQIKSPFADIANVGGREAGSITAACFLSRFAGNFRWAHLDIAGVAYRGGKNKGSTGRPVALLVQYLIDNCA